MERTSWLTWGCLAAWCCFPLTSWGLEKQPERFTPNYVAIAEVPLTVGVERTTLKKGTLVMARPAEADVLQVTTERGVTGRARQGFFSRLGSTIAVTNDVKQVAASSNRFALDLYQQAREKEGNVFLSPASISTALAMTYAGAAGDTERAMAKVLHLSPGPKTHDGYATLLQLLNSAGDQSGYTLRTANRLWGAKAYPFEAPFLTLTQEKYQAKLETLDFERQPEAARNTINDWVAQQTRQKITNLIPPNVIKQDTRLVLTNAIHFEGGWAEAFNVGATKKAPFHLDKQEQVDVMTMAQTGTYPYTEDQSAQVLSLPYRGWELSMVVVLPRAVDGLAKLEEDLTAKQLEAWLAQLHGQRLVDVYLPKFKMESRFLLSDALKSLGMGVAFTESADFSAMSKSEALMIDEVVHQAFVEVDEKGTEAAAATAVLIAPASAAFEPEPPPKPVIFRADHPFLFLIRDNRTGAILFMGRLEKPAA